MLQYVWLSYNKVKSQHVRLTKLATNMLWFDHHDHFDSHNMVAVSIWLYNIYIGGYIYTYNIWPIHIARSVIHVDMLAGVSFYN